LALRPVSEGLDRLLGRSPRKSNSPSGRALKVCFSLDPTHTFIEYQTVPLEKQSKSFFECHHLVMLFLVFAVKVMEATLVEKTKWTGLFVRIAAPSSNVLQICCCHALFSANRLFYHRSQGFAQGYHEARFPPSQNLRRTSRRWRGRRRYASLQIPQPLLLCSQQLVYHLMNLRQCTNSCGQRV
jgi:hypothetical protein